MKVKVLTHDEVVVSQYDLTLEKDRMQKAMEESGEPSVDLGKITNEEVIEIALDFIRNDLNVLMAQEEKQSDRTKMETGRTET
jgi:hypothetical protein